jgi:hypothetical protein
MSFFYETCSVEKHFFQRIQISCVNVCPSSEFVIRVGPVYVPVHVRYGVTVYMSYSVTVYIQFFTKKNYIKKFKKIKKIKKIIYKKKI